MKPSRAKVTDALDFLSSRQALDASRLIEAFQYCGDPYTSIFNASIPVWALLPKHNLGENAVNTVRLDFLAERRKMLAQGAPPETIVGRAFDCRALFDEQAFATAGDLNQFAVRLAVSGCDFGMLQIVIAFIGWSITRWMIYPTPETYEAMPLWLRPIPDQILIAHNICNDYLYSPDLREAVIRIPSMQSSSDWVRELPTFLDCNWPHSIEAGLVQDRETGCLSLSPLLWDHINNLDNWTVGSRIRAFMPNADQYIRLSHRKD